MQLTYTAEWVDHTHIGSSTLTIGTYSAHVYQYGGVGDFHWWARIVEPGAEDEYDEEIARGAASGKYAAKKAAMAAIREHHAAQ